MKSSSLLYPFALLLLICIYACVPDTKEQRITRPDTAAITALIKQGNGIAWNNPDSAKALFKQAIDLSYSRGYTKGVIRSKIALGSFFLQKNDYTNSLIHYEQALNEALKEEIPDSTFIEQLFNNLAATYAYAGDYQESARYFYKALDIATRSKDEIAIARIDNNIGTILYEIDETDKGFYYIENGKNIAYRKAEARYLLPYLYLAESKLLFQKGNFDYALEQCQRAIRLSKQQKTPDALHDAINYCGVIYEAKEMPGNAASCFLQTLALPEDYPGGKMRANIYLGKLYIAGSQFQKAKVYLEAALKIAEKMNARRELVDIYGSIAKLNRSTGDYDKAFSYYERSTALRDSVYGLDKINAVNLLAVKYQTVQKDKEITENKLFIARQKAKIVHKNTLIAGMGLAAFLLISGGLFFYHNRKRLEKQGRELAILRAHSEGEEHERARIARDLHDGIGGFLSTLKMYFGIMEKRIPAIGDTDIYKESTALLDDTITEVRKTAHNLMPELILQHGLIESVRIFCNNVQHDGQLKMDFQYYGLIGHVGNNFQLAIYRIVQELIQNILKHARATCALVQLSQHNDMLDITVEDDGIGFLTDIEHEGMGLKNVKRRVAELSGKLNISSAPGKGTTIYIEFYLQDS